MKTLKRIIAAMLLMTVLVLSLASCNGGGGNDKPSNNNGLINSKYIDKEFNYYVWEGTSGEKDVDFLGYVKEDTLSEWNRTTYFGIGIKKYAEINGTPLKKVKFDLVADRDVTVYFACGQGGWTTTTPTANVTLSANIKKTIEIPVDYTIDTNERFYVCFATNENCWNDNEYRTPFFAEWTKTQYKITNLELYSK